MTGQIAMHLSVYQIIAGLWIGMFVIWWISAIAVKRTIGSEADWQSRVALWIVALAWFLLFDGRLGGPLARRFVPSGLEVAYTGLVLTALGLGLAIWARFQIGRNWSGMVELKQDHQLIRRGPYAFVRHPIYSGLMLATFGTGIAYGEIRGLVAFALITMAWGYKSRLEEAFLIRQFGAEYEQYRREVKGLIPFVW